MPETVELKVLELFSGIGGMHVALQMSSVTYEVAAAIDINSVANDVYAHNFPAVKVMRKNIQKLSPNFINKLGVNAILMSPPCQPFTRLGNKKDLNDQRAVPLAHITSILPDLVNIKYILVENVTGFENSEAGEQLRTAVVEAGFNFRELMLSPLLLGMPNSRERYYMIAVKKPLEFIADIPPREQLNDELARQLLLSVAPNEAPSCVSHVLDLSDDAIDYDDYLIPDSVLRKRSWILDIVTKTSTKTCCFTKSYSHYVEGTGSVYCPFDATAIESVYGREKTVDSSDDFLQQLKGLRLRFFTPKEVQRTLRFPDSFSYPNELTRKQKYRLLGNSINVDVVSRLILLMTRYSNN